MTTLTTSFFPKRWQFHVWEEIQREDGRAGKGNQTTKRTEMKRTKKLKANRFRFES